MAKKIKFTSKKGEKPSKLARAGGEQISSLILYKGESIGSVTGSSQICLYCQPKNIFLRLKEPRDHRYAVDWVKEHAQQLWDKYDFTAKLKQNKEEE